MCQSISTRNGRDNLVIDNQTSYNLEVALTIWSYTCLHNNIF